MLVACRLADLSALEGHYAGVRVHNAGGRASPSRPHSASVPGPPSLCRQAHSAVLTTNSSGASA